MNKFSVTSKPAAIGSGIVIGLTAEQLALRAHNVEILDDASKARPYAKVRAIKPLTFKVGETFWIEGPPDRKLAESGRPAETLSSEVASVKEKPLTKGEKKSLAEAKAAQKSAEDERDTALKSLDDLRNELTEIADAVLVAQQAYDELPEEASDEDKAAAEQLLEEPETKLMGFLEQFRTPNEVPAT